LKDLREGLKGSVDYFRSDNKTERERWTCREFVLNMNMAAEADSFISPDVDPPDVVHREARFEVKEIMDRGRKRHAEFRDAFDRALKATDPSQLMKQYSPRDITPIDIGGLVDGRLRLLAKKYEPKLQSTLDLLFYVNLIDHHLKQGPMPLSSSFSTYGWRSISAVIGWAAIVFAAERDAPSFIREATGSITVRKFE
jgi:hypothetical protein